ncbi:MAG: cobaltochelatase subunit CobN [Deltaproteobacteria bacterium]|jgi:cobaltochelatase CobN|nr:cobaltochelatase subunit CobN [Deltaproteobacteria bacterium]
MKIAILSTSFYPHLSEAAQYLPEARVDIYSGRSLYSPEIRKKAGEDIQGADICLVCASEEPFWQELYDDYLALKENKPLVWLSFHDEGPGSKSTVDRARAREVYEYIRRGGPDNALNLLKYLMGLAKGDVFEVPPPENVPAFGLWHPLAPEKSYDSLEDFLSWYGPKIAGGSKGTVGLMLHRHFWCVDKPEVEEELIKCLENEGLAVLPVFISGEDSEASKGAVKFLEDVFIGEKGRRIAALVKLTSLFQHGGVKLAGGTTKASDNPFDFSAQNIEADSESFVGDDSPAKGSVRLFRKLGCPVLQPVVSYRQSNLEWEKNPAGIAMELSWSVTMPEFEGAIEPHYIGGTEKAEGALGPKSPRRPHQERVEHFAKRVAAWVRLSTKSPAERKVAFVLHNAPCASVEATVGIASRLDPFESLKNILSSMEKAGYKVKVPASGEEIIKDIMDHKAISDFRWTTVQEIVGKGGALHELPNEDYLRWFSKYPEPVQQSLIDTWGRPPGEEIDEVPAAMVLDGKIVITGRPLGENAVVCLQPKRGCAGARCDGRVCLILHDPSIPPPHQYLATYRWLQEQEGFGADLIVHVGTLGNLEFLPGKSVGLSKSCLTDLALHESPNIYIYNSDVTAHGMVAKRRSYAVLVDHMQTVHMESGLYGELAELRELLGEWSKAKASPIRRNELESIIREKVSSSVMAKEMSQAMDDFQILAKKLRDSLHQVASSLVENGLHTMGKNPEGSELSKFIYSILRFESPESRSLRSLVASTRGYTLSELSEAASEIVDGEKSGGEILEEISAIALSFTEKVLEGLSPWETFKELTKLPQDSSELCQEVLSIANRIYDIQARVAASDEVGAFINAASGGYVTPGPSALICRGREDVLPTGRNFYTQDPDRIPTAAAYRTGAILAEETVKKFLDEEGRYPESIAFFWISYDLLHADGEDFGEIMALMGTKPQWDSGGKVIGFEILPLSELKRPRIDVSVRMSGIIRDSFPEAAALLDRAVQAVSRLDEPVEENFVKKHTLENMADSDPNETEEQRELSFRRASSRIYSTAPGTYSSGVYFAVMASAWQDEKDLTDIYIQHNAYLYGDGLFGEAAPKDFKRLLSKVDINSHKIFGDEQDYLNCGGYFAGAGGLTVAATQIRGKAVKDYCADTRELTAIKVRTLAEELGRSFRARLFNPVWVREMKKHGYKGCAEISRRVSNTFGWQVTTKAVDDKVFDEITKSYFLDPEMRAFFEENNPWALEEIGRRLLEAESRGLWQADPELLAQLKECYLSLEGVLEESTEAFGGDLQGGAVDIVTAKEIGKWKKKMDEFLGQLGV